LGADRSDTWDGCGDDCIDGEGVGMRITVELDLDATFYESDKGVKLEMLCFQGCTQNIMPYLTDNELARAQEALEEQHDTKLMLKAQEAAERRQVAGDFRREQIRDDKMTDFSYSQWKV
jgi:Zn/Cd-binding protein ZinT